jgi:hypothetical protein
MCCEEEKMVKEVGRFNVEGWAARDESGILSPFNFTRRFLLSSPP